MDKNFSLDELNHFTGSTSFYRYWSNHKMIYTEGVQYLAEKTDSMWLIDAIGLNLFPRLLKEYKDRFYSIQFLVHSDYTAVITVGDGNGNVYLEHKIKWTDFPVIGKPVKFYLCKADEHYCLMLPSEY